MTIPDERIPDKTIDEETIHEETVPAEKAAALSPSTPSAFFPADNPASIAHLNHVQAIITRLAGNSLRMNFDFNDFRRQLPNPSPWIGKHSCQKNISRRSLSARPAIRGVARPNRR